MGDFLTTDEFSRYVRQQNGYLQRIEELGKETRGMVAETQKTIREQNAQFTFLLEREVDKREACAREHGKRLKNLEDTVGVVDTKLRMPGWVWKAVVSFLGLTLVILNIVVLVKGL